MTLKSKKNTVINTCSIYSRNKSKLNTYSQGSELFKNTNLLHYRIVAISYYITIMT